MAIAFLSELTANFKHSPLLASIYYFVIGSCFGSYFNLYAWRWPQIQEENWLRDIKEWFEDKNWQYTPPRAAQTISLSRPASFCPNCKTAIPLYLNIPVVGWIALRGKASCCGTPISIKYPLFELICGLLGVFAWEHYQSVQESIIFLLLALPLCMASQTDFESMMLPDTINTIVLFLGLGLAIFQLGHISASSSFTGIISCYASLEAIRIGGSWAFKKEAMGNGDPKFYAAIGAWIGPLNIPHSLLYAALSALIFALTAKIFTKSHQSGSFGSTPVPFGPFLAIGGLICYIWPGLIERFA